MLLSVNNLELLSWRAFCQEGVGCWLHFNVGQKYSDGGIMCQSYLYGNEQCWKNIDILNTAHFVTSDYMAQSVKEAFPVVFPPDCNQPTLRQVCTHTNSHIHTHTDPGFNWNNKYNKIQNLMHVH